MIPWRPGDARRETLWDWCRPEYEALGHPVFTGDSQGPWGRAGAVNAASEAAGDWDLALIGDADTVPDAGSIRRALAWVGDTGGAARPHDERWMLTREGTLAFMRRGKEALRPAHFARQWAGGGLLVLTRDAWEAVGGMDSSMVGWGHEDSLFSLALLTKSRWDRLPGDAHHLWHPTTDNTARPESSRRYRQALVRHRGAIARWAANKGLREPEKVF